MSDELIRPRGIAIIGGGAIGSLFGAVLAELGHQVVICGRRPNPRQTLRVDHGNETLLQPVEAITDPARAQPVDWILLATKAYDTNTATAWLRGLLGPSTKVAVLQNGIDQVDRVRPLLPPAVSIVPAVMYIAAELIETGHALWTFGETVAVPDDPAAEDFARLFTGARLRIVRRPDFAVAAWKKIMVNIATNPITTLTGRRMEVFADPGIVSLGGTLLQEAVMAGRAAGVELSDQDAADARQMIRELAPSTGTSMLYDHLAGRPTEHDLILGAVARVAETHGTPAPATNALLALLQVLPERTGAALSDAA
ncbi:2-dehydropantoate 2-reductase [Actinoplanes sp. NPDC051343]|uniref:2-dehydropantoate 2-reductase n=1 Tax=Actinoplanes sp. NPDC051343 TaxID=3363906 RepID=UPI00378D4443